MACIGLTYRAPWIQNYAKKAVTMTVLDETRVFGESKALSTMQLMTMLKRRSEDHEQYPTTVVPTSHGGELGHPKK